VSDNGKIAATEVATASVTVVAEEIREAQQENVAQHLEDLERRIEYSLKLLARYRANNDEARESLIRMIKDLEASAEYQFWSQKKAEAEREMAQMERLVKQDVLDYLNASGKKPAVKAVGTRNRTLLEYDVNMAMAWCQLFFEGALALNRDLFEKHARAVAETNPVPVVTMHTETIATISQDLSAYLGDGFPE
jgi:hypothetical protein